MYIAMPVVNAPDIEEDSLFRIIMFDGYKGPACIHNEIELFKQLSFQRGPDIFPRPAFAAREFPQATQMNMVRPQCEKYPLSTPIEDDPDRDVPSLIRHAATAECINCGTPH